MPDRHFYLLRHHILFYIKFLLFCFLAPDDIRISCEKIRGFPRSEYISAELQRLPNITQQPSGESPFSPTVDLE